LFSLYFLSSKNIVGHFALFTIAVAFNEFALCGGFFFSYPDFAGPFATLLFGFGNSLDISAGFVNPLLVAHLTPNGTREEWLNVFYISGAFNFLGMIAYALFGTSELEPWAKVENEETVVKTNKNVV